MTGDPSLYQMLIAAGCKVDNHESDLYVEMTDTTQRVIREYKAAWLAHTPQSTLPLTVQIFRSTIDGKLWYDIPFMYEPWWTRRQAAAGGE